jgi:hypothetical protein
MGCDQHGAGLEENVCSAPGTIMNFELCGNYQLRLLSAAAIGYGAAHKFQPSSAYTFAFKPAGITITPGTFEEFSIDRGLG